MTKMVDPLTGAMPIVSQPVEDITVQVGQMAPGGHCVAQHDGRAVFVRHAIPGETVVAKLTGEGPSGRFLLADTIEVLTASDFRRAHHWKLAESPRAYAAGRPPIAGAEFGHIVLEYQRRLKAKVFRDAMVTLAGKQPEDMDITVNGMEGDGSAGLRWRTRNAFVVSADGRLSMPVHGSLERIPVRNVPLAVAELDALELWDYDFTGAASVIVSTPTHGREALISITPEPHIIASEDAFKQHIALWRRELADLPEHVSVVEVKPSPQAGIKLDVVPLQGRNWVSEDVASETYGTHHFRVSSQRTWPVHQDAPVTLVDAVMTAAAVEPGHKVLDLYAGAGLYSRFLADAVGSYGSLVAIEPGPVASLDAKHNLQGVSQATVVHKDVNRGLDDWLGIPADSPLSGVFSGGPVDTVVLNTPAQGAQSATLSRIDRLQPDKLVYLSSHTPSLARDTRWLEENGWTLDSVDAYDLAPNTQQMHAVCVFTKTAA